MTMKFLSTYFYLELGTANTHFRLTLIWDIFRKPYSRNRFSAYRKEKYSAASYITTLIILLSHFCLDYMFELQKHVTLSD